MYGYNGKILHVDLERGQMETESPNENFYRKYIGNGILGAYYLLTKTAAKIDAFSPENLLMFMSGAVCGLEAPGLARFSVCGKSPVTGGIGEARSEGPFAIAIKKTGFDGIVIQGRCKTPSVLLIDNGKASLVPAEDLWGMTVGQATDRLEKLYPSGNYAVIGPAGENKVRFANIITDRCHEASRSGMGAVMGSKNLKAVVLFGGKLPGAYNEEALKQWESWFDKKMHQNTLSMWQYVRPGFGVWIHTHGLDASLGVNNYQSARCEYADAYRPEAFDPFYKGEAPCPGCPNNCIKCYSAPGDDERAGGLHQEASGALGPNIGVSDVELIVKANVQCNELGLDPNSLGYTISFAQECVEKGLLNDEGMNLSFSNQIDLPAVIEKIAYRKGIGDLLAEGSGRAAAKIGGDAPGFAMVVKNNEMVPFEPRSQTNLALGYAAAPLGPNYIVCEHDWDFDTKVGWDHTLNYCRTLGILDRIPMEHLGKDKVRNYMQLSNLWSASDALGICLFATAPTRVYSLENMAALVHDITGWETSSYEIMRLGEMRNHIFRLYNNREGLTKEDDMLPDRFYSLPIDFGPKKGVCLDKGLFREVVDFYYQMMGWDREGRPLEATLYRYGLESLQ